MIYDKDTGLLYTVSKSGKVKQCSANPDSQGYLNYARKKQHRIIWELFHGEDIPSDMVIDHINNIPTDNRIVNLQLLTRGDNNTKELTYTPTNKPQLVFELETKSGVRVSFNVGSFHDKVTREYMWNFLAPLIIFRQELKGTQYLRDAIRNLIENGDIDGAKAVFKQQVQYALSTLKLSSDYDIS